MAKFLNTSKAFAEIEDIVSKAKSKLFLITPFISVPETLLKRLKYADERGVKIIVVCREKDLKRDVKRELKQLRNLELRFDENLHAKCFFNEESMVITSLNLHEYSQRYNREMGVLLTLKDDPDVFNEACSEAEFIVNNARKDSLISKVVRVMTKDLEIPSAPSQAKRGWCIRCGERIPYELKAPYCSTCYQRWREGGGNPDYEERNGHCHSCGKEAIVTKTKPLCNSCYQESRK